MQTGIPSTFSLLGHKIDVVVIPAKDWKRSDCVGIWLPQLLRIEIKNTSRVTALQQVFCHEWVHAMLDMMSHPLSTDEQFVDQLGHLLQQSLTTFEMKNVRKKSNRRTNNCGFKKQ
jgi:hypothetical protein